MPIDAIKVRYWRESGHGFLRRECPLMVDIVEKVESSAALQNCQNDIEIFNRLKLPGQIHLELATFVELRKMRSPTSAHLKRAHEAKIFCPIDTRTFSTESALTGHNFKSA
jgi:hypothetical protein